MAGEQGFEPQLPDPEGDLSSTSVPEHVPESRVLTRVLVQCVHGRLQAATLMFGRWFG